MAEKVLRARQQQKFGTEAEWNQAGEKGFVPLNAEFIVYESDDNYNYQRLKIGDGITNVKDLPFWGSEGTIDENSVGQKTEQGGEIFNDYENNKALGPYTKAEGAPLVSENDGTITGARAGSYGYRTMSAYWNEESKSGTIELADKDESFTGNRAIDHYAIGDLVCFDGGKHYYNKLKIQGITISKQGYTELTVVPVDGFILEVTEKNPNPLARDSKNDYVLGNIDESGNLVDNMMEDWVYVISKPFAGIIGPFTKGAKASGEGAIAVGRGAYASGRESVAAGNYAHAEGRGSEANYAAHAEGLKSKASGSYSHAEGQSSSASGESSHAEGQSSKALGKASHAEGVATKAKLDGAHAEGYYSEAENKYSHAEGEHTSATGQAAHSEGQETSAKGKASHSEGFKNRAEGINSHVEGEGNIAPAKNQHIQGTNNLFFEIVSEVMTKDFSEIDQEENGFIIFKDFKINENCEIYGTNKLNYQNILDTTSFAKKRFFSIIPKLDGEITEEYLKTIKITDVFYRLENKANNEYKKYSILKKEEYAHVLGNGNSNFINYILDGTTNDPKISKGNYYRSNAHTVDWDGNAWFSGDVYIGSNSGIDKDEGSKKLATEEFVNDVVGNISSALDELHNYAQTLIGGSE